MYRHLYYALNLIDSCESNLILDIGCGDAPFLPTLNRYGKRIIGLDIAMNMIRRSKELINYTKYPLKKVLMLRADGQNLPLKNNSIDLVFCLETFEHINKPVELTNEIYRVLKNNGVLIYSLPIEIGFPLIVRQIISKFIKFQTDPYTFKELIKNGIFKKPLKRKSTEYHKNFDWRIVQKLINKKFIQIKYIKSPFPSLYFLNVNIIVKVKKVL